MTEIVLSLGLSAVTVFATAGLLRTHWERTRCAYLTFEAAHSRLGGASLGTQEVHVVETTDGVRATGRCGWAREVVELPWLDGQP